MNWLPAEQEKVEFFEKLGWPRRLIPRRIYYGVVGNQKRYFALKLPLAAGPETVTFAYVDPGHANGYRTPLVGSRAWAALGRPPHEGPTGPGDRDSGGKCSRGPDGAGARSMGGGGPRDTR